MTQFSSTVAHFTRKRSAFVALAALTFALLAVGRPALAEPKLSPAAEISSISVPFVATADQMAAALNKVVGRDLYKGTAYGGASLTLTRTGAIGVTASDNFIYLTVPVTAAIDAGMFSPRPIATILKFRLTARVNPDWSMVADVAYVGLVDQVVDSLRVGPVTVKPASLMNNAMQPVQKLLSTVVTEQLNAKYPLRPKMVELWRVAQKPLLVSKEYNAWLRLTPREVLLQPLATQNNKVQLCLALKAWADLTVGPEPAAGPVTPLPNLKTLAAPDRAFHVALAADVFYQDLAAIARPLLVNKNFDNDGKKVTVTAFDLAGDAGRIKVTVTVAGDYEGRITLIGTPVIDPATNVVTVRDLDYDLATSSWLLGGVSWLLHSPIAARIQEKLRFDLTAKLADVKGMANKALSQVKLSDATVLHGTVTALRVADIQAAKDRLAVRVAADGETAITLQ